MSTATLPRIQDLSPADRKSAYELAAKRAMDAAHEMAVAHNARKVDPRSILDYRVWKTMGMVCVLVVKHRDRTASTEVSRDGNYAPHVYLPTSKQIAQPESTKEFLLICIPKWLAERSELMGVTPDLCDVRPWTDAQRQTWSTLRNARLRINSKIYTANRRSPSVLSRSAVA